MRRSPRPMGRGEGQLSCKGRTRTIPVGCRKRTVPFRKAPSYGRLEKLLRHAERILFVYQYVIDPRLSIPDHPEVETLRVERTDLLRFFEAGISPSTESRSKTCRSASGLRESTSGSTWRPTDALNRESSLPPMRRCAVRAAICSFPNSLNWRSSLSITTVLQWTAP